MDRLVAMRSFVRVADAGSIAAAARSLGLSAPMVGNHVRFLERRLGGLLLNRTTRAQSLTELGATHLERCRRIFAELDAADEEAAELVGEPRGTIRMTAPHAIGSTLLPRLLARFCADHPAVRVDLQLDNQRLNLLPDGIDLAIRAGPMEDASLVTRALRPIELVVCAAPAYLHGRTQPKEPQDLADHSCLDFAASSTPGVWCFETDGHTIDVPVSGPIRANCGNALRLAALAGAGIVMQPASLLREDLADGSLVRLLPDCRPRSRPIQLVTLPGRRHTPKLRLLVDALVAALGPNAN